MFPTDLLRQYTVAASIARMGIVFEDIVSVVELGSGGGQLAQAIRSLYPHIEYYCIDLPTQLYVAGQILKVEKG